MKKSFLLVNIIVLSVIFMLFIFVASGMAQVVIKYAHVHNPGIAHYDAAEFFADKVKELSNGEIECEVFPSAQLGGEREVVESLMVGNVHISHPNWSVLSLNYPRVSLYQLPFLFKDFYHVKRVAESEIGQELNKGFEEATGLTMAVWYIEAPRGLFNNQGPIYEPEQMKGRKIRVMESELYRDMFGELGVGALPTPLAYTELYTALATNLVEFADPPVDTYYSSKFYEVAKYFSFLDHVHDLKPVVLNAEWFNGLAEEHQEIIMEALKQTSEFQINLSETQQAGIIEWLTCNGFYLNLVNKCAFQEAMKPVYDKWTKKLGEEFANKFIEKANELASE
jgi:tripartite ATP-independent transporter DctP family solute receptor